MLRAPQDLDEILPPPPKPERPMMLMFICVAGMVLYPITFMQLLFPMQGTDDLVYLDTAPLRDRLLMFTVATLKVIGYKYLFDMRKWAAILILVASVCKLGLSLYFGAPHFIGTLPDGRTIPGPMLLDLVVAFNIFAYWNRLKSGPQPAE